MGRWLDTMRQRGCHSMVKRMDRIGLVRLLSVSLFEEACMVHEFDKTCTGDIKRRKPKKKNNQYNSRERKDY